MLLFDDAVVVLFCFVFEHLTTYLKDSFAWDRSLSCSVFCSFLFALCCFILFSFHYFNHTIFCSLFLTEFFVSVSLSLSLFFFLWIMYCPLIHTALFAFTIFSLSLALSNLIILCSCVVFFTFVVLNFQLTPWMDEYIIFIVWKCFRYFIVIFYIIIFSLLLGFHLPVY